MTHLRRSRVMSALIVATAFLTVSACTSGPSVDSAAGKTFTYGVDAIPPTLDVSADYSSADMALMSLATQPLEAVSIDGRYQQVLAASTEQPTPTTIVYNLRPGVRFSDGAPLTPDDVVFSLQRLLGESTQTGSSLTTVSTIKATGPAQVTVTLSAPDASARGTLALVSFIQQKKFGEANAAALGTPQAIPVGTGPYKVSSYGTDSMTYVRNPDYWGARPTVDEFRVVTIADDNSGQLAMRSSALQGMPLIDIKSAGQWDRISGVRTFATPTLFVDYLTMDTAAGPFSDIHVRRAVAHATDVRGLLHAAYRGQADAASDVTPPQVIRSVEPSPGAADKLLASTPRYGFDLDAARRELAQSTYPNGFEVTFPYYDSTTKLTALNVAENLRRIGITVKLQATTFNDYIGDISAGTVPDISLFHLSPSVPDPSSWYSYVADAKNPYNLSRWSTPTSERALTMIASQDRATRWTGVSDLVTELATQVPFVTIAQPRYVFAVGNGWTFTRTPDVFEMTSGNWANLLKAS